MAGWRRGVMAQLEKNLEEARVRIEKGRLLYILPGDE